VRRISREVCCRGKPPMPCRASAAPWVHTQGVLLPLPLPPKLLLLLLLLLLNCFPNTHHPQEPRPSHALHQAEVEVTRSHGWWGAVDRGRHTCHERHPRCGALWWWLSACAQQQQQQQQQKAWEWRRTHASEWARGLVLGGGLAALRSPQSVAPAWPAQRPRQAHVLLTLTLASALHPPVSTTHHVRTPGAVLGSVVLAPLMEIRVRAALHPGLSTASPAEKRSLQHDGGKPTSWSRGENGGVLLGSKTSGGVRTSNKGCACGL
jgi:hypothetical protein